ncbi:hypothetical protein D3C86_1687640 [compost metagenome]
MNNNVFNVASAYHLNIGDPTDDDTRNSAEYPEQIVSSLLSMSAAVEFLFTVTKTDFAPAASFSQIPFPLTVT